MSSLKERDNPVSILIRVNDFLKKYNSSFSNTGRLANMKRWLYRNISYPVMRKSIKRSLIKNMKMCYSNPVYFISVMTNFVGSLIYRENRDQDKLNDMISKVFVKGYEPLKIVFITDPTTEKIKEYKLIVKNLSFIKGLNYGNMTRATLTVDIQSGSCDLSVDYYDSKKYIDNLITAKPTKTKYMRISATGELINSNYILSEELQRDDYKHYCLVTLFLFTPIIEVFSAISTVRFIPVTFENGYNTKSES